MFAPRAAEIITPMHQSPPPRSPHPADPVVAPETPITQLEPAELTWVRGTGGETAGYITAVQLAAALRERLTRNFWHQENVGELLRSVFEDALDAIVVVNAQGQITFLKRAYEVILGVPREQAIGQHVTKILPNSRMHIVARSGVPEIGHLFRVGDQEFIVERHPIFVGGRLEGAVGRVMFRDIGDFRVMANRLNLLQRQVEYYEKELSRQSQARYTLDDLTGSGPAMAAVKALARRAARSSSTVLILGESGTGKELLAHGIHNASPRARYPFVKVNCAAIPKDLLESELFGYEAGAFSGALKGGKQGKFELANRGTIFLDEIGDMSLEMQAKVLRALQEREIQKIGGTREIRIDVRIIAATNKNLAQMVAEGTFREDLYYRLNVIELEMPPLRRRTEDIPALVRALMQRVCTEAGIEVKALTPEAMAALQRYPWPGNVRELVHVLERLVNTVDHDLIDWADLPPYILTGAPRTPAPTGTGPARVSPPGSFPPAAVGSAGTMAPPGAGPPPGGAPAARAAAGAVDPDRRNALQERERELILDALRAAGGNKSRAAEYLGIHRSVLYRKMARYGIQA